MTRRKVLFDQDRLDAYNLAREFVRAVEALLKRVPRGFAEQFDQVRRASTSILFNTAEGAGEFAPKEKARFYRIARRSATESAAVLDSFVDRGALLEADIEPARMVLNRVTGALTRLIQSCDPDWMAARTSANPHPPPPRIANSEAAPGSGPGIQLQHTPLNPSPQIRLRLLPRP